MIPILFFMILKSQWTEFQKIINIYAGSADAEINKIIYTLLFLKIIKN